MGNSTEAIPESVFAEASRNQTAKKAAQILLQGGTGFLVPTAKQKRLLLIEFARRNLVVYGKAFDVVRVAEDLNLDDSAEIAAKLDKIVLCEVKSSNRKLPEDFKGYFFALTTAELLVAQNLKERFKFIFVNIVLAARQHFFGLTGNVCLTLLPRKFIAGQVNCVCLNFTRLLNTFLVRTARHKRHENKKHKQQQVAGFHR